MYYTYTTIYLGYFVSFCRKEAFSIVGKFGALFFDTKKQERDHCPVRLLFSLFYYFIGSLKKSYRCNYTIASTSTLSSKIIL